MQTPGKQQGMTLIGWVVTLAVLGFFALIAIRLVPVYIESYTVGSVLKDMASEGQLAGETKHALRETFGKRLSINEARHVSRKDLKITDVAGGHQLVVDYEARVPLISNIDLVASFHKQALVRD